MWLVFMHARARALLVMMLLLPRPAATATALHLQGRPQPIQHARACSARQQAAAAVLELVAVGRRSSDTSGADASLRRYVHHLPVPEAHASWWKVCADISTAGIAGLERNLQHGQVAVPDVQGATGK